DRGNRFLTRVITSVPHEMHELVEPSLAVIDGFAGVVFLLGVIGVEEAADARMARAIDMKQLAVPSYTAASPDVDLRLGFEFIRRQLDHGRKHVRFRIRVYAGPWRLAAEMRLGEVSFASGVEQVLDSVEVEKERVATAAGEKSVGARPDGIRRGAERHLGVGDDLRPDRFGRVRLRALRREYADGLPAVLRLREHIAERDVRQVIAVFVDVDAIDCIGMKRVRVGICVQDDDGPGPVSGRLECVQVTEVESLIAERRAETETGEVVRHCTLLPNGSPAGTGARSNIPSILRENAGRLRPPPPGTFLGEKGTRRGECSYPRNIG